MAKIASRGSVARLAWEQPSSAPLPTVLLIGRIAFLERMSSILRGAGFPDEWARTEGAARAMLESAAIGMVVIDGGLTTPTDFSACSRLAQWADCPVIMMTTGDDDSDRILALELGADDCMSATRRPAELLARIRAALRRGRGIDLNMGPRRTMAMRFGEWRLDQGTRRAFCPDGRWVRLGPIDMIILESLARNSERLTPPEEIIEASACAGRRLTENHLRVQISRLRARLGRDGSGQAAILSVRTKGYALTQDSRPGGPSEVPGMTGVFPDRPGEIAADHLAPRETGARIAAFGIPG